MHSEMFDFLFFSSPQWGYGVTYLEGYVGFFVGWRLTTSRAEAGPQQPRLPLPVRQRLPQEHAQNALRSH